MSRSRIQAYQYFQTDDIPTEEQFQFVFNNIWFKDERFPTNTIEGLTEMFEGTLTVTQFDGHLADATAHTQTLALLDGSNLSEDNINLWKEKLKIIYAATIDGDGVDGNVFDKTQILEMITVLQSQDDETLELLEQLREMLTSNDVNLDELQEIVDYIKQNREQIELLQQVIVGSTTDDKVNLVGEYSFWGAVTMQNQFNDIVYDKLKELENIVGTGKFRHQELIRVNSTITHDMNTFDFVLEAYDTVTLYTLPVKVRRIDLNSVEVEFDTTPENAIQITIRKI